MYIMCIMYIMYYICIHNITPGQAKYFDYNTLGFKHKFVRQLS